MGRLVPGRVAVGTLATATATSMLVAISVSVVIVMTVLVVVTNHGDVRNKGDSHRYRDSRDTWKR